MEGLSPEFPAAEVPYGAAKGQFLGQVRPGPPGKSQLTGSRKQANPQKRFLPPPARPEAQSGPNDAPPWAGLTWRRGLGRRRLDGRPRAGGARPWPGTRTNSGGGGGALSPRRPGGRSRGRPDLGWKEAGQPGSPGPAGAPL